MISIYIEASTIAELRARILQALDETTPVFDHAHPDKGDLGALFDEEEHKLGAAAPQGSPPDGKKARRAHRRTKPAEASPEAPVAPQEAETDPLEAALDALGVGEPVVDDEGRYIGDKTDPDPMTNAVELELVKREVISKLADLFASGQVAVLRKVLAEHGNGAKSFPEIDAAAFPAIKAALSKAVHA